MPDPAFLLLIQHLQVAPPAITRSAPVELAQPSVGAYLQYVGEREQEVEAWLSVGKTLRSDIWSRLTDGTLDLTVGMLDDMIELHHRQAVEEARTIRRLEKSMHQDETDASNRDKANIVSAHRRLVAAARRFYDEGRDFGMFLHAVRAVITPEETSENLTFSDPRKLHDFLMA